MTQIAKCSLLFSQEQKTEGGMSRPQSFAILVRHAHVAKNRTREREREREREKEKERKREKERDRRVTATE